MFTPSRPSSHQSGLEFKSGEPGVEMLFNRTEDFQPDIHLISTDLKLLARCE